MQYQESELGNNPKLLSMKTDLLCMALVQFLKEYFEPWL